MPTYRPLFARTLFIELDCMERLGESGDAGGILTMWRAQGKEPDISRRRP